MHFSAALSSCAASRAKKFMASKPPYFGMSEKEDNAAIKEAGGKWHRERKSWYAPDLKTALDLLRTEVWVPFLPNGCVPFERGAETSKLAKELAAKLGEPQRGGCGGAPASASYPSDETKPTETEDQARKRMKTELQIEDDEPRFLDAIGEELTSQQLEASAFVVELGPRSGLSNARRVHRGVVFLKLFGWEDLRRKIAEVQSGEGAKPKANDRPPCRPPPLQKRAASTQQLPVCAPSAEPVSETEAELALVPRTSSRCHMGNLVVECGRCGGPIDTAQQFVHCWCDEWLVCSQCGGLTRALDSGRLAPTRQFASCKC